MTDRTDSPPLAAVVQMQSGASVAANLERATMLLAQARRDGARLAVLPENFALMGAHERDKLAAAETDGDGPIQRFLAASARELGLWIVAGTVPLAAGANHVYGACLVYDDAGRRAARYDKIHLFDVQTPDGRVYRESASLAAGTPQAVCVDGPLGRLGLSVCYDLRFPELYRRLAAGGAQVLCVPSAFTVPTGRAHWLALLSARAIENQCYVLAAAQCGQHPGGRLTYGHSLILDPWGEVLAQLAGDEGVACARLDLQRLREVRADFPALAHRRL
ncbi:MAG: carbon-nitrogen hydrolase family protein [Gammaproteobacteria bacterium]|nr:carbon-nitrogen hydrolase family protein [Gammaproteobacteria bacterium]